MMAVLKSKRLKRPKKPAFSAALRQYCRYVGATIGGTYGGSEAVDKNLQAVNLQFNIPAFKSVKTVLNGDIGTYTNTYTLELSDQDKATLMSAGAIVLTRLGPMSPRWR